MASATGGLSNSGLSNGGVANSGAAGNGGGVAYLTGSAPSTTQGQTTGWTGSVTNLSGSDQTLTV
jgi:hypothetical protein